MMGSQTFTCYLVDRAPGEPAAGGLRSAVTQQPLAALPAGDVLIRVHWSAVNYKDALAASGHPGVTRAFPHVPGIDAGGVVVESCDPRFAPGDPVLVHSCDVGAGRWGAWAEYLRTPGDWVVPLVRGLSLREAMIYGSAGVTAVLCIQALQRHGVQPECGEVVVTGATGGVGCFAVIMLAQLGYEVAAVTGKSGEHERLRRWGARRVLPREEVDRDRGKPLLSARWAGAVDTVGGWTLATLLRQTGKLGCVAACGLVGGAELPLTVYPFILRGVTLAGIDATTCFGMGSLPVWEKLAGAWRVAQLETLATTIGLRQLDAYVQKILRGEVVGRVVVDLQAARD